MRRARWSVVLSATVLALGGCSTPAVSAGPSSQASGAPSPGLSVIPPSCPAAEVPETLDVSYLGAPLALDGKALVIEVLVAQETGDVDLGKLPLLATFRLEGSAPTSDPKSGLVAFEAGTAGMCSARILMSEDGLAAGKSGPLLLQLDVAGATMTVNAREVGAFCTWLPASAAQSAGIECVGMPVSGPASIAKARAWLRVAWGAPMTGALPAWTAAAIEPAATPVPGAQLVFTPLDGSAFELGPNPPLPHDGPSIRPESIAWRTGGWVAAGAYSPLEAGGPISDGDAPVWFSPDGTSWRRVDTPAVFGGDGYQSIFQALATDDGWWLVGASYTGTDETLVRAPLLWRSTNGTSWQKVEVRCPPSACTAAALDLTRIAPASATGAGAPDELVAIGNLAGDAVVFKVAADGDVTSVTHLPLPGTLGSTTIVRPRSIAHGTEGWVVLADAFDPGDSQSSKLAWSSVDGSTWTPLTSPSWDAVATTQPEGVSSTPFGWLAFGQGGIARSPDLTSWATVLPTIGNGDFLTLAIGNGFVVVLGYDPAPVAWSTSDGATWVPVLMPANTEIRAGASDGSRFLFVGGDGSNGGVWLAAAP